MNGRKAIAGVCMLCALLASAVAAQSASAITGTTAVTCAKSGAKQVGVETFNTSHCLPGEGAGEYEHYEIAANTSTELAGHAVGNLKAKATLGGVATTLSATGVEGAGTVENKVDASGEHYVQAETTGVYTGVTVSPFTKCFVYTDDGTGTPGAKGVIDTQKITTTSLGQGHSVKVTPKEGSVISRFWILDGNKVGTGGECSCAGTYTMTGSLVGQVDGATFKFTHTAVTEQNTFKIGTGESSIKAGFEGQIALEGKDPKIEKDTFKPISVTTVST